MTDIFVDVVEKDFGQGERRFFEFRTDFGYADVIYSAGWLGVSGIEVEDGHRRQGIGKALLSSVREKSEELRAKVIYASIISRESIVIFQRVFGEENILVSQLGTFAPDDEPESYNASALLFYRPNYEI
jgi:GNAT superfamily N-acetyltransferase